MLNLQAPLLAANPNYPRPTSYPDRPAGQPTVQRVGSLASWKHLVLPTVPSDEITPEWLELAFATVEHAYDRWAWAHHHAACATARRTGTGPSIAQAVAAWSNYWQLIEEFDRLRL